MAVKVRSSSVLGRMLSKIPLILKSSSDLPSSLGGALSWLRTAVETAKNEVTISIDSLAFSTIKLQTSVTNKGPNARSKSLVSRPSTEVEKIENLEDKRFLPLRVKHDNA